MVTFSHDYLDEVAKQGRDIEKAKASRRVKHSKKHYPADWQHDPSHIGAFDKIQYWRNGVMVGLISNAAAKASVCDFMAYVMTDQAVGALNDDGSMNS